MTNYQIITDSGADLPTDLLASLDVKLASLSLLFRGQILADSVTDETKTFYQAMREGESATTSAINPDGWAAVMEPVLKESPLRSLSKEPCQLSSLTYSYSQFVYSAIFSRYSTPYP